MTAVALSAMISLVFANPDEPPRQDRELASIRAELQALRQESVERREELRVLSERLAQPVLPGVVRNARSQDRVGFGESVRVARGEEVEQAVAFGRDVWVDGVVRGDVTALGGDVTVTSRGIVFGDAVAFGGEVTIERGGQVLGDRVALEDPTRQGSPSIGGFFSSLFHKVVLMLSFAGAGVLVIGLFPDRVERVANTLQGRPIWSGVLGVSVSVLLTAFAVLFALITIGFGTPVSLLGMGLLGAAWMFGFVGLCQAIGDRLPFAHKPNGRWLAFLVGTIALTFVGSLPWIGIFTVLAASMVGIGATFSSRFGSALT